MKKRRSFLYLFARFVAVVVAASIGWALFVYGQQWNYGNKGEQLYLIGSNAAYAIVFLFLLLTFWLVLSLVSYRHQPKILKRRFIWFAVFYLLASPLVILSFDSYLSLTKKGVQYNDFFTYEGNHIINWDQIEKVEMDYSIKKKPTKTHQDLRLKFILVLKNNKRYDLNHINSPLYSKDHFVKFAEILQNVQVPIEIVKPLPKEFQPKQSFYYQLFQMQAPTN
ncbi:hypothetical protein [Risungbinella massiliensis]|uniref:hypothetical protein n=1 Tax=Risungbinella massiliensis TaxID=1329796 RepID=UPI0005CC3B17|nr:hypothetical protein [Risungbinella massiliensis]